MEDPDELEPSDKKTEIAGYQEFKKNDFSIKIEEKKDGKHTFYVKSEDFFQRVGRALRNVVNYLRIKFRKAFPKKDTEEQQYRISKKIYSQQKKLEKKLEKIEDSLEKTQELAGQIREDKSQMSLEIDTVVTILEYQMDRFSDNIEEIEDYMRDHLGSDWFQIENSWNLYKDEELTRGEFTKIALIKLGRIFLSIFVNTSP
jgi:hypothetical protein